MKVDVLARVQMDCAFVIETNWEGSINVDSQSDPSEPARPDFSGVRAELLSALHSESTRAGAGSGFSRRAIQKRLFSSAHRGDPGDCRRAAADWNNGSVRTGFDRSSSGEHFPVPPFPRARGFACRAGCGGVRSDPRVDASRGLCAALFARGLTT